jgi:hypothetical protein
MMIKQKSCPVINVRHSQDTYVVAISRLPIQVVRLLERDMGIRNDPRVMLVVVAVGVWQKPVQEKGIAGFGLDGCEVVAVFDMAT